MLWIALATDLKRENVLVVSYEYLLRRGRFGLELWCDYDINASAGMMKWMDVKSASKINLVGFKYYTKRQLNYGVGRIILKFIGVYVIIKTDFIADTVWCDYAQYIKEEPGDILVEVHSELDDKVSKLNRRMQLVGEEPIYYTDGLRIIENKLSVENKDCRSLKLVDRVRFADMEYEQNLSNMSFIENPNCTCIVSGEVHKLDYINADAVVGSLSCYIAGNLHLSDSSLKADKLYLCIANRYRYNLEEMGVKVLGYGSIVTYRKDVILDFGNLDIPVHKGAFILQDGCIIRSRNKNMITRLSKLFNRKFEIYQSNYEIYLNKSSADLTTNRLNLDEDYIKALVDGDAIKPVEIWRGKYRDDISLAIGFRIDTRNNSSELYCYDNKMSTIPIELDGTEIKTSLNLSEDIKNIIVEASRRLDRAMAVYGGYRDGMGKVSK